MWNGYTQNGTYNREYPRQARQVKASRAAVLPLLYCTHTTNTPFKASVYVVLQQLLSQFVANLSLISCLPAMVRTCWRRPSPAVQNEAYSRYLPAVLPREISNTMAKVCTTSQLPLHHFTIHVYTTHLQVYTYLLLSIVNLQRT